jgi:multiple sugar transport system substrate-binding protein
MLHRRDVLKGMALAGTALSAPLLPTAARAEAVTLDVLYAFPAFAKFHEPIAQEFMKQQGDIKISFRAPAPSYDEGHQTMMRQSMTNQLPDVYYAGYHLLAELVRNLVKRKQITEVAPLLAAEDPAWRAANYADSVLALGKVDSKMYGLAFNASLPIVYINEQLVRAGGGDPDNMPTTWEDMIKLGAAIKAKGSDLVGITYSVNDWPDDWLFRSMILQGGGSMLDASETKAGFSGDVGLKAMTYFRRFVTEAGMPLIDWDQARQQFIAGKVGIFVDTPARLRQVTDLIGDKFTLRTRLFPIDDKAKGGLPTGGNAAIITAKDPAKQKAAWEFLKFVSGPLAQKMVVETSGYMPTNLRASGPEFLGPFYEANPNFRTVSQQLDRARPWQGYPGGNSVRIWRTQRDVVNAVMRGELTAEAGLKKAVDETNGLMSAG